MDNSCGYFCQSHAEEARHDRSDKVRELSGDGSCCKSFEHKVIHEQGHERDEEHRGQQEVARSPSAG